MPSSLTETAYYARKAIRYGITALIVLIVLRFAFVAFLSFWRKKFPSPPPPPNVQFGRLTSIDFPKKESTTSALTYKLETVSGSLPKMPTQARIYFIPPLPANIVGFEIAKEKAKDLGFETEPVRIDERSFQWTDAKIQAKKLTIDIVSSNFEIFYDFNEDQSVLVDKEDLPSKEKAIIEAKNLLANFRLLKEDIDNREANVTYIKYDNGSLVTVPSLLEASFTKVSLLRKKINDLPIYYLSQKTANLPLKTEGPIEIIFSGSKKADKRLVSLKFNYRVIDYQNFATYPIVTADQAYDNLKAGLGYVDNFTGSSNQVTIREVILSYLETENEQAYLQPIYVFKGDENFKGYVIGLTKDWLK